MRDGKTESHQVGSGEKAQSMGKVLLGIILGFILAPFVVLAYLEFGKVPVPWQIHRSTGKTDRTNSLECANGTREDRDPANRGQRGQPDRPARQIYRDDCAVCHGCTMALLQDMARTCIPPRRLSGRSTTPATSWA